MSLGLVRLRDRGGPPNQRRDTQRVGVGDEIKSDRARGGWNGSAPCFEVREIRGIGTSRAVGDAIGNEVSDPFDEGVGRPATTSVQLIARASTASLPASVTRDK
jgi:hypothetical protein